MPDDFFSPPPLDPERARRVVKDDIIAQLADAVFDLSDTVRKDRPIRERQARALEDATRALETVAPRIESAEKHMAAIDANLELYLPAAHLDTAGAKDAADKAAALALATSKDTQKFRVDMEARDVGKLGPWAQIIRSAGDTLAKLATLDLIARAFVIVLLVLVLVGIHYAYPLFHSLPPVCK